MTSILIAEDEPRIASFLRKGLRAQGYATTVATDGVSALDLASSGGFDLLVLDLGLPLLNGMEVLTRLRGQGSQLPVIVLTARDTIADVVAGLDGGADDYMPKPFSVEELLARIRLRLREQGQADSGSLDVGDIHLELRTRRARIGSRTVDLSAREFMLAETLLRNAGQVLSREQLQERVWGYDHDPGSNVVDVYIGYLRRKLGPGRITTVRGMGYRLER